MKRSKKNRGGIILGSILALCQKISEVFSRGLIAKALAANAASERLIENSATISFLSRKATNNRSLIRRIKRKVAFYFEESLVIRKLTQFFSWLLSLPIRVYGSFFLTFGAYVILISLIKRFLLGNSESFTTNIVCGSCVLLSSIPLLFSGKSLRRLCGESVMVSTVLVSILGISSESFKEEKTHRGGQSAAVVVGIVCGLLTYFVSPITFLVDFLAVAILAIIFIFPEVGVVISIGLSPFLGILEHSSITVGFMVVITAASYLIKYIRGKRVLHIGITEVAVLAFMSSVLLSAFAPSVANTEESALILVGLMLIYFLIDSLFRYRRWINIGVAVLAAPSTIIAFIGICQHLLGLSPSGWLDTQLYGAIDGRAVSLFDNPNVLGVYLAMMFPLSLYLMMPHNSRSIRFAGTVSSLFIVVCTVFTYSRSAWLGLIVGAFIFLISISPKCALLALPAAGGTLLGILAFPDTFGARIINFFSFADSANNYRIAVWNSVWDMLGGCIFGGIGAGDEAFSTAYLNFAAPGTESVAHSHSLYLQILLQLGIVGLIIFALAFFLILQKSYSSSASNNSEKAMRFISNACVSGAVALLFTGLFDYTWYNRRVFFLFWVLLGLAVASVNVRKDELEHAERRQINTSDCAEITVSVSQESTTTNQTEEEE